MKIVLIYDIPLSLKVIRGLAISRADSLYSFPLVSDVATEGLLKAQALKRGAQFIAVDSTELVGGAADFVRGAYLKWVADFSTLPLPNGQGLTKAFALDEHATLWWFSIVAEKNSQKTDSFNSLVQLEAIARFLRRERIAGVCCCLRNTRLGRAVQELARQEKLNFAALSPGRPWRVSERLLNTQHFYWFKHILLMLRLSARSVGQMRRIRRAAGPLRLARLSGVREMIITYYPHIDLKAAKGGEFKNQYYRPLQEALAAGGRKVVWIAMYVQHQSITFADALLYARDFNRKGQAIFFLEQFASRGQHLRALVGMLLYSVRFRKLEPLIRRRHTFGDYNFYKLFTDEWYSSFAGCTGYCGILYYSMFKQMFSDLQARSCLYYFEGHAWENALISARDAVGVEVPLYGYQHATVSRMLLNYFHYSTEVVERGNYALPLPEKIICNGQVPYGYMQSCGYASDRLAAAEAIRYNHLKSAVIPKNKSRPIVLVALSMNLGESASILRFVSQSFQGLGGIEVWIKAHPFLDAEAVMQAASIKLTGLGFQVQQGKIIDLLSSARVVIAGESGVAVEALALGCCVIQIKSAAWINMSPLAQVQSSLVQTAASYGQLHRQAVDIMGRGYDPEEHAREAKRIIYSFFNLNVNSDIPQRLLDIVYN